MIEVIGIGHSFGTKTVLSNIQLILPDSSIVGLAAAMKLKDTYPLEEKL